MVSKIAKKSYRHQRWDLFFLALPFIIFVIAITYVPIAGWYLAFIDYEVGVPIWNCDFVGFNNFMQLFKTKAFIRALKNTLIFSSIKFVMLIFPVLFAILFNEIGSSKYRRTVQTITTLPNFISWIIVYGLTYALFTTDGLVNQLLENFGLSQNLLINRDQVYIFQSILYLWKGLGWDAIIYVAAITGIDTQLYEAASIDGAGHFKSMLHVTIPGIMPTFTVMMLLGVANFISNGMDQYLVFQNAFVYKNIETLELYTYKQGLKLMDYSYATAVGIMKSVVSVTMLFMTNAFAKKFRGESII